MSNMPYQMVYSNCQSRAEAWVTFQRTFCEIQAIESGSNQSDIHLLPNHPWKSWEIKKGFPTQCVEYFYTGRRELYLLYLYWIILILNSLKSQMPMCYHVCHLTEGLGSAIGPGRGCLHYEWWLLSTFLNLRRVWDVRAFTCKINLCFGIKENGRKKTSIIRTITINLRLPRGVLVLCREVSPQTHWMALILLTALYLGH